MEAEASQLRGGGVNSRNIYCERILKTCSVDIVVALYEVAQVVTGNRAREHEILSSLIKRAASRGLGAQLSPNGFTGWLL